MKTDDFRLIRFVHRAEKADRVTAHVVLPVKAHLPTEDSLKWPLATWWDGLTRCGIRCDLSLDWWMMVASEITELVPKCRRCFP